MGLGRVSKPRAIFTKPFGLLLAVKSPHAPRPLPHPRVTGAGFRFETRRAAMGPARDSKPRAIFTKPSGRMLAVKLPHASRPLPHPRAVLRRGRHAERYRRSVRAAAVPIPAALALPRPRPIRPPTGDV